MMRNAGVLALATGVNTSGYNSFTDAISGSVSEELAEDGVKITSLDFVDGKVVMTVETETETSNGLTGPLAPSISVVGSGLQVVAKVYFKENLSDDWGEPVKTQTITAGGEPATIDVGELSGGTSGFYQVVVEPTTNH